MKFKYEPFPCKFCGTEILPVTGFWRWLNGKLIAWTIKKGMTWKFECARCRMIDTHNL